jgi:phenylpropionate dioxygenase-like ring-hydroxylating dioxygenase large terminal subunit
LRLQGLLKSPDDLPAGEGTVLQQGTDKVAAYRDPNGQMHTFAAACPHLGCLVQWNKNEKSFDCPVGPRVCEEAMLLIKFPNMFMQKVVDACQMSCMCCALMLHLLDWINHT